MAGAFISCRQIYYAICVLFKDQGSLRVQGGGKAVLIDPCLECAMHSTLIVQSQFKRVFDLYHDFQLLTDGYESVVSRQMWYQLNDHGKVEHLFNQRRARTKSVDPGCRRQPTPAALPRAPVDHGYVIIFYSSKGWLFQSHRCHNKSASDVRFLGSSSSVLLTAGASSGEFNLALWDTLLPQSRALVHSWVAHTEGATVAMYIPNQQVGFLMTC